MLRTMLSALLLLVIAAPVFAQVDSKRYDPTRIGPRAERAALPTVNPRPRVTAQVRLGDRAPDFELEAASGAKVQLSRLRGQWVALFFVSRREGLPSLDAVQRQLEARGVRVVAVCTEKTHSLRRYLSDHPSSAMALSDPMSDVAALYGLFDNTRAATLPGMVLLDIDGVVRLSLMGQALPSDDATRMVQYAVSGL
ncbi:MAG: peroxiredoxin family protein [Candidatus Eisenbacteria bacterium]